MSLEHSSYRSMLGSPKSLHFGIPRGRLRDKSMALYRSHCPSACYELCATANLHSRDFSSHKSYSLNSLKGVIWGIIWGTTMGVIKRDTRNSGI